jgi:hypothetical protein
MRNHLVILHRMVEASNPMKHILVTFDNDTDAEIFVEAMNLGSRFDFNGLGTFGESEDDWIPSYHYWGFITTDQGGIK